MQRIYHFPVLRIPEIELGTVYSAEMGIALFSDIDRYTLEDTIATLS